MVPKKCAGTVTDRATKAVRPCRRPVGRKHTFCYDHREKPISTSNSHVATEHTTRTPLHTPPATPLHIPATSLHTLPATPLASVNASRQTIDTSHDSTRHKANIKSVLDGNLSARREAFCANLEDLTLVKMDCGKKIESLFRELEGAADTWGNLEEMIQSLLYSVSLQG